MTVLRRAGKEKPDDVYKNAVRRLVGDKYSIFQNTDDDIQGQNAQFPPDVELGWVAGFMIKSGNYRYVLGRILCELQETADIDNMTTVVFVCKNPSTATQKDDDPTVRFCIYLAKKWVCIVGRFLMDNKPSHYK